jgi:hypothetical protein
MVGSAGCAATPGEVRAQNQRNLVKLSLGMTKEEVLDIMGTETIKTTQPAAYIPIYGWLAWPALRSRIVNPYRTEMTRTADGSAPVLLIFYVTDEKRGALSGTGEEDLTPLVFEDGKLVGWGWNYLERNIERYQIDLRLKR